MRSTRCGGVVRPGGQGTPHLRGRSFMNLRYVLTNRQSMPRMGMCVSIVLAAPYRRSSTQRTSKLKRLERSRYAPNLDNFPP
jgi:hypothetical protein